MRLPLFIAKRLTFASTNGRTSPAIKVAVVCTALCVAVMLLAVSVVGGFRHEIVDKITGFDAHITILSDPIYPDEERVVSLTPALKELLDLQKEFRHADLMVTAPVLLKTPEAFKGVYLRGVDKNFDFSFIRKNLVEGHALSDSSNLVISAKIANKLGLHSGDSINMYYVGDQMRARRMNISGIFDTHLDVYDNYFIYGSASLVREWTGLLSSQGSQIDLWLNDFTNLDNARHQLVQELNKSLEKGTIDQNLRILTAKDKGSAFFVWLDLLDTNVWVILTLMTLVALFTLTCTILVIIMEKVKFIGIMKAVGAPHKTIRSIFVLLGLRIAIRGLLWGNALALSLILLQHYLHIIPLDSESYYMDFVPTQLDIWHLLAVNVGFLIVLYMTLIIPATFVSRIKPAQTMRYE